ncbi:MAG: hypothetical protein KQJ78_09170 [Deltaproteobacteria bacterium]|nr:hypothetical protein [Deltaproteobacteria bacterium]
MAKGNQKKKLAMGTIMLIAFFAVLVLIFLPIFGNGNNGLNYMDNLYNSISKASAYYIPGVQKDAEKFLGRPVEMTLTLPDEATAAMGAKLVTVAQGQVEQKGDTLTVKAGLGKMLMSSLSDSDAMFHNQADKIAARYPDLKPREVVFTWWQMLKAMEKSLNKQELFPEAKFAGTVMQRAVEPAYNYYGIVPESIGERWGLVVVSLIFYVVYTVWYGFAVMFIFEGIGMQLEH